MGIIDRCDTWPNKYVEVVKKNIPFNKFRLGDSTKNTYTTSIAFKTEEIVISYNVYRKVFIVWNVLNHKDNFTGSTKTLSLGAKGEEILKEKTSDELKNDITSVQKNLRNNINNKERIYIVGENALFDFCRNYKEYIFSNEIFNAESDEQAEELVRKYIQVFRKQRDSSFRKKVLKHYNYTCIICGCQEIDILEAAHINPVSNEGSDDVNNGYCLCANHHLLFDTGKLIINKAKGTFSCENTSEINSLWYRDAEKRGLKLFLPNKMEGK